jgi:LacI family transcriptional regulator
MNITQQQLAERLGVSQMAVSFALNDKPGVNAKTRRRILAAAADAGYRPHAGARATRHGRSGTIELILGLHEAVSRIPVGLLEGLHDEMAEHGLRMLVGRVPDEKLTDQRFLPSILREVAADGLLINYTHWFPPQLTELIRLHRIPAIWLNAPLDQHCVRPDDVAAGRIATEHLLAAGCKKVALYVIGHNDHYSVEARRRGHEQGMDRAGLPPQFIMRGKRDYAQIRQDVASDDRLDLTRQWLEEDKPDGVVAYSLAEASMIVIAAAQLGLRMPDDLQLCMIGDEVPTRFGFAITTVRLPWAEIGRQAIRALEHRIAEPDAVDSVSLSEIPPRLELGVTTAPQT